MPLAIPRNTSPAGISFYDQVAVVSAGAKAILDLPRTVEMLETLGVLVVGVRTAELPAFYDVLAENMHRKGTPIYGIAMMRAIVDALGDRAEVVTLALDGRAVSGAIVLTFRDTVYVPFCSSRPSSFADQYS